ncbi:hypothetical protein EMIHUDRAFT_452457 [Emiliania huxleyi CCMP1516]|uniref:WD40 repeat-containing protein n=2 Tax=Emiliania huxleyi TaxID=2903 RepID=A0A0D3IJF1_EMIH1|nr:hypothetical protein EMIHUDRAFT_452457 [Emiliania huxleyi CCMP1516]EOD11386.1 hypothetical protein EMIHUDRAFT_452457 [Emiliania huxleyi CCMP1516]|eukprot:XP_005763815.1 hypothetical protein EMIHUDRAFT_452457 [Emiliania huxleyi CCMP1516]
MSVPESSNGSPTELLASGFRRADVVRLVTQCLHSLGYERAASELVNESGVQCWPEPVSRFRAALLHGEWGAADALITNLHLPDPASRRVRFLELSTYLLCRSVEELKARSGWDGGGGASRRLLLDELQEHIPPSLLLPENRLETLLQQAVRWQTLHAPPLTPDDVSPSLFEDVSFRHDGLPREASLVLEGHADEVWCVAFSHSGAALASASRDGAAACKCWPPRGASLTCSRLVRTGAIVLWNATNPQFARRALIPAHSGAIATVAWSPDDTLLLSCAADRTVKLWNAPAGDCAATFREHTEAVTAVVWLPSGAHFLSSSSAGKRVILWDLGGNALQSWHGPRVTDLAVAADGARLLAVSGCTVRSCPLTAGSDGTPRMVTEDVHSWDETDAISSLAISRDSRAVLLNVGSQEVHAWDVDGRRRLGSYSGHRQGRFVIRSAFGGKHDGLVLSGSEDTQVYVWHRHSGALLRKLPGHSCAVNSVSWSPASPHLFASASDDHTVRIWGLPPPSVS